MGFLEPRQLELALEEQRRTGQRLGAVLIGAGWISEARLVRALSRQLGIPMSDPVSAPVHERVRALIPREMAQRLHAVPIALKRTAEGDVLCVVTSDPLNHQLVEEIVDHLGMGCEVTIAGETEIEVAIAKHYGTQAPSFVRGGGSASLPPVHLSLPPLPPHTPPVMIVQGTPDLEVDDNAPIELEELVPEHDDRIALMDALAGVGAVALSAELDASEGLDWDPPARPTAGAPTSLPPPPWSVGSAPPAAPSPRPTAAPTLAPPVAPTLPPSASYGPSFGAPSSLPVSTPPSPSLAPPPSFATRSSAPPASAPSPSPPFAASLAPLAAAFSPPPPVASGPRRIQAGAQGALDPLDPRPAALQQEMPSIDLDPLESPPGFSLPLLLAVGVELPEASASMVDASMDLAPLTIPEGWQEVSFSGLVSSGPPAAPVAPPRAENWGDFFPSMTGSLPLVTAETANDFTTRLRERDLLAPVSIAGLPPQSGRTVEELGIAPPTAFSREEKSLSIDIEVVELESPFTYEVTARTRVRDEQGADIEPPVADDVLIEEVPEEVVAPAAEPVPDAPTRRPSSMSGVESARILMERAATGAALTSSESMWLLRCLSAVLLDSLDDGRLAAIVSRLGDPPLDDEDDPELA